MNDETFKNGAYWVGGIVAAIVIEAVLVKLAQRCMPRLFSQQPVQPRR